MDWARIVVLAALATCLVRAQGAAGARYTTAGAGSAKAAGVAINTTAGTGGSIKSSFSSASSATPSAAPWSQLGTKPYLVVTSGPHKGKCVDIKRPLSKSNGVVGLYPCVFPKPTSRSSSCTNCTTQWQVNSRGQLFRKGTGSCLTVKDTAPVVTSCASSAVHVRRQTWQWRGGNGLQSAAPGKTPAGSCLGISSAASAAGGTLDMLLVECGSPQQLKLTLRAGA